ncbi:MAG TPA: family 43 glycosylhydrolase, partial [Verrucomicrobiae bacterium]
MKSKLIKKNPLWSWSVICLFLGSLAALAQSPGNPAESPAAMNAQPSLHLSDFHVHDPWILAHAPTKTYYLYTSNVRHVTGVDRPGTMVYRSQDLLNWEGPSVVFTLPDGTWADANHAAWAPEVHEYKNRFYLFTTLHNPEKVIAQPPEVWRINHMRGTVIAVSDSPEGPFT